MRVPKNIAEEITEAEARARQILQDARTEGARLLAQAKAEAEDLAKGSRQSYHRTLREKVLKMEEEADKVSEKTIEKGRDDSKELVKSHKAKVDDVANLVAEEVMARYGSNKS